MLLRRAKEPKLTSDTSRDRDVRLILFIGPPFCTYQAHAFLLYTAIQQVVTQGDTQAGGAYPVPAVLALLKVFGLL